MLKQIFFISTAAAVKVALHSAATHHNYSTQLSEKESQMIQAIKNKDFAEAERLKEELFALMKIAEPFLPFVDLGTKDVAHSFELEAQRLRAVAQEDYALADRLEQEIKAETGGFSRLPLPADLEALCQEQNVLKFQFLAEYDQIKAAERQDFMALMVREYQEYLAVLAQHPDLPADIAQRIDDLEKNARQLVYEGEPWKAAEDREEIARILQEYRDSQQ